MNIYKTSITTKENCINATNNNQRLTYNYFIEAKNLSEAFDIIEKKYPNLIVLTSKWNLKEMEQQAQNWYNNINSKNITVSEFSQWPNIKKRTKQSLEVLNDWEFFSSTHLSNTMTITKVNYLLEIPTEKILNHNPNFVTEYTNKLQDKLQQLENLRKQMCNS